MTLSLHCSKGARSEERGMFHKWSDGGGQRAKPSLSKDWLANLSGETWKGTVGGEVGTGRWSSAEYTHSFSASLLRCLKIQGPSHRSYPNKKYVACNAPVPELFNRSESARPDSSARSWEPSSPISRGLCWFDSFPPPRPAEKRCAVSPAKQGRARLGSFLVKVTLRLVFYF